MKIERSTFDDPPKTAYQRIGVEGLRGGAVVLMVATFEAYLKDVFIEVIQELEDRRSASRPVTLTPAFLLANDFDGVEAILRDRFGDRTAKHAELKRVAASIARSELVGDGFSRTEANPRPDVLAKMLKRFGIGAPFTELAGEATSRGMTYSDVLLRTKLDEILDRRNEVAHTGVSLNVTRQQLHQYVTFVQELATLVDATIVKQYKSLCT